MQNKKLRNLFFFHGKMDMPFFVLTMALLVFGLIMLFSASYANAYYYEDNSYYFIMRQMFFAVVGVIVMLAVSYTNYKLFFKYAIPLWLISLALLVVTYFMPASNGARRWIYIGRIFSFQPSEIAKFALIIVFARLIYISGDKMKKFSVGVIPFLVVMGSIALLMVFQPHMSGTILVGSIGLTMMFIGGTKFSHLALLGGTAAGGLVAAVMVMPDTFAHVIRRLDYWLNPWLDPADKGYQSIQSLLAIGSGGVMGVGLGESRQKYLYLPEVQNDFIFPIIAEELGFIGASMVIILFALLIWRGFYIAMKTKDKFGAMIVIGISTQIGLQAFLNIAVVTNTVPNTGISLPFFSYGGTALVMMLAQIGVLLSVSRQSNYNKE